MDLSVSGALGAYAYQSTLTQGGSAGQALTQALAAGRAQAAEAGALVASVGPVDAGAGLPAEAGNQGLAALAYRTAEADGKGPEAVKALLSALGGGVSALPASSDGQPTSAASLAPAGAEALARYAYDQSQNPSETAAQAAAAGQQSLLGSGLNLLG